MGTEPVTLDCWGKHVVVRDNDYNLAYVSTSAFMVFRISWPHF